MNDLINQLNHKSGLSPDKAQTICGHCCEAHQVEVAGIGRWRDR